MTRRREDEIIDECVERLLKGEPLEDILRSQPGRAAELLPVLRAAASLHRAPRGLPAAARRDEARSDMLAALQQEATAMSRQRGKGWLPLPLISSLPRRALAGVAAAVLLVAGLSGAGAAGVGPFEGLFGGSDTGTASATTTGAIVTVERDLLGIETAQGIREVFRSALTKVLQGEEEIQWAELQVGQQVDVTGEVLAGGGISAERVHVQPPPDPNQGPGAGDDDDRDDDDRRGPDPGPSDGDDRGPGNGEDDAPPQPQNPDDDGHDDGGQRDHDAPGNSDDKDNGGDDGPGGGNGRGGD